MYTTETLERTTFDYPESALELDGGNNASRYTKVPTITFPEATIGTNYMNEIDQPSRA